jgi:Ca2+-binding RTX toxin-like protein
MITIKLSNVEAYAGGVNYDSYMTSYFADFAFEGWPYITGGGGQYDGDQLILLDNLAGRNTKTIVMDGTSFSYHLAQHTMSGTLTTIRLGTLGDSYNTDGSFKTDGTGHIVNVSSPITISGLSIANGVGTRGDFHSLTAGLMGSVSTGNHSADASILRQALTSEAISFSGSAGHDTFTGTRFSDVVRGAAGNDKLNGGAGHDKIYGDAGKDKVYGGVGSDKLWGGSSADTFIFKSIKESTVKASGRDTINDFSARQKDKIDLRSIDANTTKRGNQAFSFIGNDGFHNQAGEVRFDKIGKNTFVYGDVNGDGVSDFSIHLKGALDVTKAYFYL